VTHVARLRLGTSSFSEKSWVGPFYPAGTKPAEYLAHYATAFDTVEVDSTYYAIPSRATVEGWARKTPARFTFALKFPRSIVHGGAAEKPDPARVLHWDAVGADTERFLGLMELLGPRRGALLLQFPYFNQQAFREPAPFFERLDAFLARLPRGPRYAVELRNKAWIGPAALELLARRSVALALSDLVYMPHPLELWRRHGPALLTADHVYGRLIGDRKAIDALTDTFDRVVVDQSPRLAQWVELLRELSARNLDTFVYVNNHYAGHGPGTVRELAARLTAED
jgi:uncharacterized protein YecE (DUF72 family)